MAHSKGFLLPLSSGYISQCKDSVISLCLLGQWQRVSMLILTPRTKGLSELEPVTGLESGWLCPGSSLCCPRTPTSHPCPKKAKPETNLA